MFIGQINETWERLAAGQDLGRIAVVLSGKDIGKRIKARDRVFPVEALEPLSKEK